MTHRQYVFRASFVLALAPVVALAYVGCGGGNSNSASGNDGGSSGSSGGGSGSSSGGSGGDATTGGPYCGDGVVNNGEQCDFGAGKNQPGSGCEQDCKFSCTTSPNSCMSTNTCAGTATCSSVTGPNGDMGQKCVNGSPPPDGTSCGANGLVCKGGQCTSANCGNGTIDTGEQCDDGNNRDLDGCDSRCNYEVVVRMTDIAIQGAAAPSYCSPTTNRLGTQSLNTTSLGILNGTLTSGIDAGTDNVMAQFLGLSDLTGQSSDGGVTMGVLSASLDPAKGTWPNQNPIDWWFLAENTTVANGLPASIVPATLSAGQLSAGPADVTVTLALGGSPAALELLSAHLAATIDGTPAPNVPGPPPTKLANGLTVFQQVTGSGANQGLCGNITVESLAQIPIPKTITTGNLGACGAASAACTGSASYTYCGVGMPVGPNCNSLLDALVGGCKSVFCSTATITPEQPDVAANGTATTLSLGPGNKVPQSQWSGNKDAYSAYLTFQANRAHFTGQTCTQNTDCQKGQSCTSGVCK